MPTLEQDKNNLIVKKTIVITSLNAISRGIGFIIPFFIADWFGINSATDSFFFAYSLILLLANIFSPVMETIVVPFIAEKRARDEPIEGFMARLIGLSGLGLFLITGASILLLHFFLPVITKFSEESLTLVFRILSESSPLVILTVWTSILSGILNAYKIFSIPAISPAFRAAMTLLIIFLFKERLGVHSIALGYLGGEFFRAFILIALIKKFKLFRFKLSLSLDNDFLNFLRISSYHMLSMATLVFIPVVNKTIATWLGTGNVSLLEYAERLYYIPITLLSSGLFVAVLSYWSEDYYKANDKSLINKNISGAFKFIGIISFIMTLIFYLFKDLLVDIVYGHSLMSREQILSVKEILGFYLIGIIPYFLTQLYVRAFLIKKKTKILFFTALFMFAGTIAFDLILIRFMGVSGIALGSSLTAFLSFGILGFSFNKIRD